MSLRENQQDLIRAADELTSAMTFMVSASLPTSQALGLLRKVFREAGGPIALELVTQGEALSNQLHVVRAGLGQVAGKTRTYAQGLIK